MTRSAKAQTPPLPVIRDAIDRVLSSKAFIRSERMKRFLSFVANEALAGKASSLKEYPIAVAVYDKPASFDSRIDPLIRVEASRLRAKLLDYYEHEGHEDPIIISIRKGSYAPLFRRRRASVRRQQETLPGAAESYTASSDTRHYYLMGRHYWNKRSPAAVDQAIQCFKQAIATNPTHAPSYAGLSTCHAARAWFEMNPPSESWQQAQEEADRALGMDPSLSEPAATLAFRKSAFDWEWSESEADFRRAIASQPREATVRDWYAFFCLAPQRRLRAALEEVTRACNLDPLSPAIGTHLGCVLYFRRAFAEAATQYEAVIEMDPTFYLAYWYLGFALIQMAKFTEAESALRQAQSLGCSEATCVGTLAYLHAIKAETAECHHLLSRLEELSRKTYVSPLNAALVYAGLGDRDASFRCIEQAVEERSARLIHLKVDPAFDPIKRDARFISVLSRIHLA